MAEKDGDGPSLELPSLGFGRKRGKKARGAQDDAPVAPEPAAPAPEPAPLAPELAADPAPPETPPEPAAAPEADAGTETQPTAAQGQAGRPTAYQPPVPPPEPTAPPLFADELQDSPTRTDAPPVADEPEPAAEPKPKRQFKLPAISPMAAALLTGAVVGLLMVGLTGAGFRFCELVQGAPSCGDPGFLLLLAIVIIVILVGKALLDAWDLPDPGSTSFLAVGLLSVVALLFLVDVLFNWWMIIVIPVLAMLCFALSHWVTTAFVDDE